MNPPPILDAHGSLTMSLAGVSLIEASAGTGKTYTIANLYLRHILSGRLPSEILVVTFTNAATDELHQRIQSRLYQALRCLDGKIAAADEFLEILLEHQQSLTPQARADNIRALQHALRCMDEAMISTIHGFCHSALQDHALFSQQMFESEIVADDEAYWELALKDWWRRNTYELSSAEWSLFNRAVPGLQAFMGWHRLLRNHHLDPENHLTKQD